MACAMLYALLVVARSRSLSMVVRTEYQGLRALEYAAQTGAQLMRRSPRGTSQPLATNIAYVLWTLGIEDQIFCVAVDHAFVAAAEAAGLS